MSIKAIFEAVVAFNVSEVVTQVEAEIQTGTGVDVILNEGLIGAMDEVGRRFSEGDLYVPEMLRAAKAMKQGLEILKPLLSGGAVRAKGTIVIGTVKGDLHDIGKNLVAMMMEGAGFNVIDLGVDVDAGRFAEAVQTNQADLVAVSALLTDRKSVV